MYFNWQNYVLQQHLDYSAIDNMSSRDASDRSNLTFNVAEMRTVKFAISVDPDEAAYAEL